MINGATDTVAATVPVGSGPVGVAVDPTTHAVYVANSASNTVSMITVNPPSSPGHGSEAGAAPLADLDQAVQRVGPGASLTDKIAQAQSDLATGEIPDTCGTLGAFIHEVQAQSGKHIATDTASQLVAEAQDIQAVLVCRQ